MEARECPLLNSSPGYVGLAERIPNRIPLASAKRANKLQRNCRRRCDLITINRAAAQIAAMTRASRINSYRNCGDSPDGVITLMSGTAIANTCAQTNTTTPMAITT